MASQLTLALVGCGGIAAHHLAALREVPRIRIVATVDPVLERAQAVAAETGAAAFTSLDDAIEGVPFDAVDLMLPHDLHEGLTIQALEAAKHVLLEKPMAATLDACERMLAAARTAGTVFMVAENAQYWPEIVTARELVREGRIGEVVTARANYVLDPTKLPSLAKEPWREERARMGGGIVIDGGSHWLRPLRMWMGEIEEVVAVVGHPFGAMEGESLADVILAFESGSTATFHALRHTSVNEPDPWWRITGTEGEIVIDHGCTRGVVLFEGASPDGLRVGGPRGYTKSFAPELEDFARAVLDGKPLEASAEYSLGELRAALAIHRSAETRRWERVWD